jgi:dTDP-4-amino-4,6-dideoxygalactose transaminase
MILMNDFKAEPVKLIESMVLAAKRVIESGWFVLGNEVSAFEKAWATTCGSRYGVGVGNGMDAIEIGLRAMDIGPGDEVITTPMTAFATVLAILRTGATPVLADIDPQTALLSIESTEQCIGPKTKVIVLVHLYGQVRQMDEWNSLCAKHNISLFEDCAQAHLATWNGKVAGSFGEAGAYSFYPTKNLGALGDAGMLVTQNEILAQRASCLRNYGQSTRYFHPELGLNSRLDEMQAAILTERIKWLPEFTLQRRKIATMYLSGINNSKITLLAPPEETDAHVFHLFVITCKQRDALQRHLQNHQVQSLIHYPIPVHKQEPCRDILRNPEGLSHCDYHAATCISLPCHPQMSANEASTVIEAVNSFKGV